MVFVVVLKYILYVWYYFRNWVLGNKIWVLDRFGVVDRIYLDCLIIEICRIIYRDE